MSYSYSAIAHYLVGQIMREDSGALDYTVVINKFPQYKEQIDTELKAAGREDLIVNTEEKNNYIKIDEEKITINNECISIAA